MEEIVNARSSQPVLELCDAVCAARERLGDADRKIGDGDHGINMHKGFSLCRERIAGSELTLPQSLQILSDVLMNEIGGSMGPLYGTFFEAMAENCEGMDVLDAGTFGTMLTAACSAVTELGGAKPGDKTMVDCLWPAMTAYRECLGQGGTFPECLAAMKSASAQGLSATVDMVARVGRASRLGERSRGIPDAGATSCDLILHTLADSLTNMMKKGAGNGK